MTNDQKKLIAAGAGVLAVGAILLLGRKKTRKMPTVFRPGQTVRIPSGASFTLQLPGGTYDLLGSDAPQDIIVLSTARVGDVVNITLMAPDTSVPYEVTPTWVDVEDPTKRYSIRVQVRPGGAP